MKRNTSAAKEAHTALNNSSVSQEAYFTFLLKSDPELLYKQLSRIYKSLSMVAPDKLSELLAKLSARADLNIKSANALTRQLNPFKSLLHLEYDICYLTERSGKERTLHLTRIPNDDSDDTVYPSTDTVTIVTE